MDEKPPLEAIKVEKKSKTLMFGIRIEDSLYEQFSGYMLKHNLSKSQAIRSLLAAGLEAQREQA
jgi:hypothetical protein